MLTLSANIAAIAGALALLVPAATNLLTHLKAPSALKAGVMIVLAAVDSTAVYVTHLHGAGIRWQGLVFYALEALVVAGATYTHAYKPTGLLDLLNKLWGNFGLGKPPAPDVDPLTAKSDAELEAELAKRHGVGTVVPPA